MSPAFEVTASFLLLSDQFDVEFELYLLGDEEPTRFEGHVPGEAPTSAVDRAVGREDRSIVAPRIGDGAHEFDIESDGTGYVANGQITGECPR
jgi:hypothetical protein